MTVSNNSVEEINKALLQLSIQLEALVKKVNELSELYKRIEGK